MSQVPRASPAAGQDRDGLVYHPHYFSKGAQLALLSDLRQIIRVAPLFQPIMPRTGKPFSVSMTNCGSLGWVSDRAGYRYQPLHPANNSPWPPIPSPLIDLWREVSGYPADPEACLINIYGATAKMGSHQDRDEQDFKAPVISVSLGDDATFHVGGLTRTAPKSRYTLRSGDVLELGGQSRLAFHGIDKVHAGTSSFNFETLAPGCRRINLTMRRVTPPPAR